MTSLALVSAMLVVVGHTFATRHAAQMVPTHPNDALDSARHNEMDRLPSQARGGFHSWPTTNDPPEANRYLGGNQYARPDGEVFTALTEEIRVPDATTLRTKQNHASSAAGHAHKDRIVARQIPAKRNARHRSGTSIANSKKQANHN